MRFLPLYFVLALLSACGGSGGGGDDVVGGVTGLEVGTYRYYDLTRLGLGDGYAATSSMVQSDGVSSLVAISQRTYSEGAFIGPVAGAEYDFRVEEDRTFFMHSDTVRGRLSADGILGVGVSLLLPKRMSIVMKTMEAPTFADLQGEWLEFVIRRRTGMTDHETTIIAHTIGGAGTGGGQLPVVLNEDSHVSSPPWVFALNSYSILPSGEITMSTGGIQRRGAISADGELMIFAGSESTGMAELTVMVRVHPAGTTLSGTYAISNWESQLGAPFTTSGTWDTDVNPVKETRSIPLSSAEFDLTLDSITPEGVFEYTRQVPAGTNFRMRGLTAASGNYAVIGGGLVDMNNPMLTFLIR